MRTTLRLLTLASLLTPALFLGSCASDARTAGVERRQDRIDTRTSARQERWKIRGEREDARAQARFDAM